MTHMFRFQVEVGDEWVGELTRDYYLHLGSTVDPANTSPAPLVTNDTISDLSNTISGQGAGLPWLVCHCPGKELGAMNSA